MAERVKQAAKELRSEGTSILKGAREKPTYATAGHRLHH
jgi:hypothetical protein